MAKDIQSIERTTLTPNQNVSSGNAFDRLGDASSGIAQMISNKANELAIDEATKQGQRDALRGDAPKTFFPPITKATAAYNNAVSDTEARHLVNAAHDQIQAEYLNSINPATYNADTPAMFNSRVQGIVDGTLENTRDSNRAAVQLALEKVAGNASVEMLKHSIDFDNKQAVKNLTNEVDQLTRDRRNAAIQGNKEQVAAIDENINKVVNDYAIQNAAIARNLSEIKRKIALNNAVDNALGDYAEAASQGKQDEYLNKLAQNKDNIPFDQWEKITKEVLSIDATNRQLSYQARSESYETVVGGINNGTITSSEQILQAPDLTPLDQIKLQNYLEAHNRALAKSQYDLAQAQKNIANGNPGFNTGKQKNAMFQNAMQNFEAVNKVPMTLTQMADSIMGVGNFPASGMPGVPLGSNVPMFDAQMSNQLTSRDPAQIIQAAAVYNDIVEISKKPNMLDINGKALAIATAYNNLNIGGVDQIDLANRVSKAVLDADEPAIQTRSDDFNFKYSAKARRLPGLFKQVFDTSYTPGVDDAAMGLFKETFRQYYLMTGDETSAINATRHEMRGWGSSKYFQAGMVGQPVPEKELTIVGIGYAFDNQIKFAVQDIINRNATAVAADPNTPFKIEWIDKNQSIDINKVSQTDRVFKPLGTTERKSMRDPLDMAMSIPTISAATQSKPRVKINGQETEIFLMPMPESRLGQRLQYGLFYTDKFGMAQPVPDDTAPNGNAMFSPVGMETWAPSVLEDENKQQVLNAAISAKQAEVMGKWRALTADGSQGLGKAAREKAELFRQLETNDTAAIEAKIRQKLQGNNASQPAEAAKADNTGIAVDQKGGA